MPPPSHDEALRAHINRLGPWHHDVEVAPGVWTGAAAIVPGHPALPGPPLRPGMNLQRMLGAVYPGGLEGRTFLDCACNAGGYSFAALDEGASAAFGFDAREHWIAQAEFLAERRTGRIPTFAVLDLLDLPALGREPSDVTLFSGILYHLPDPVAGLRIAADHTRELLILNTATKPGEQDAFILNIEGDREVMSGVHRLAWLPTGPAVLREVLAWCGFPYSLLTFELGRAPAAPRSGGRLELLAAREAGVLPGGKHVTDAR